ncbi:MAG: phosphate signaling complex protein PhoU [Alphaproteobacteria bacterium]
MAQHTDRRYEEELAKLRQLVLEMGGLVESQIADSVRALASNDAELARATIGRDHEVNRYDVEIDEECLRLLALHQPAARDLRLITTGLKITTDLERIGDLAVNVCERVVERAATGATVRIDLPRMADTARGMLRESLDAFVREDADLALKVCRDDDAIDALHASMFREVIDWMGRNPESVIDGTSQLFVSKYLERIADHATNIAEMVIFMVKGKSIRHLTVPASL